MGRKLHFMWWGSDGEKVVMRRDGPHLLGGFGVWYEPPVPFTSFRFRWQLPSSLTAGQDGDWTREIDAGQDGGPVGWQVRGAGNRPSCRGEGSWGVAGDALPQAGIGARLWR